MSEFQVSDLYAKAADNCPNVPVLIDNIRLLMAFVIVVVSHSANKLRVHIKLHFYITLHYNSIL